MIRYWEDRHRWDTYRRTRMLENYGVRIIDGPESEPITLDEAHSHLRISAFGSPPAHPDDEIIQTLYIPAAREWCELYTGLLLATQTVEIALDTFGNRSRFWLPIGPVQSVASIMYLDADGTEQTLTETTDYLTRLYNGAGSVYLPDGVSWPNTLSYRWGERAVFVRYVAGYTTGSPDDYPLPKSAKAAMLLVLGHLYENREQTSLEKFEEIPLGAKSLLDRIRVRLGFA